MGTNYFGRIKLAAQLSGWLPTQPNRPGPAFNDVRCKVVGDSREAAFYNAALGEIGNAIDQLRRTDLWEPNQVVGFVLDGKIIGVTSDIRFEISFVKRKERKTDDHNTK